MKALLTTLLALLGLSGCSTPAVQQYSAEKPVLDITHYLNGHLDAWGMFQGRSGEVVKRFHVSINAVWQGDMGTIDEQFKWSDGTATSRTWKIKRQSDGRFLGNADDVIGDAIGEVSGNALHWRYVLALPVDGKVYNVDFDDWMFLMDERVMFNRSTMKKWGFSLGEVTLMFQKP
jgi:hypothetical protein